MICSRFAAASTVVLISLGLLSLASCLRKNAQAEAASTVEANTLKDPPRAVPAVVATSEVARTAKVTAVDAATRTVTLLNDAGETHKYQCGPDVRNFDQIHVGDTVHATIVERLAIYVRKQGTPPNAAAGAMMARAAKGEKPGVVVSETVQRTATVTAADPDNHTVTIKNVEGEVKTYRINPDIDLTGIRVGDDVVAQYSRGLAILVVD